MEKTLDQYTKTWISDPQNRTPLWYYINEDDNITPILSNLICERKNF